MDIDMDTRDKYMSDAPVIDPATGYALNYPLGLQIGPGPERDALLKHIIAKREEAGIVVEDDLLAEVDDPDAGRSTFDLLLEGTSE